MSEKPTDHKPEATALSPGPEWDRWAGVREQLEQALQEPGRPLEAEEAKALLKVLRFSLVAQAELHLLRPEVLRLEEAREIAQEGGDKALRKAAAHLGWRRGSLGRGPGVDWTRAAREYALDVERGMTPIDALRSIQRENNVSLETACGKLESVRAEVRRELRQLESGPAHPPFLRAMQSIVYALDQLPKPHLR